MQASGVEVLVCAAPETIFHLTGYQTFGYHNYQLVVVPMEREPFLVLRFLESVLAQRYAWTGDVVTWDDTEDPVAVTVAALRDRGLAERVVGVEETSAFLRVAHWRRLQAALPRMTDGSGIAERARIVKSPREVAYMREAARITDLGAAAALAECAEGRSENDAAAAAYDAMVRAGSEWMARDPIVTSGDRAGLPHSGFMRRRLAPGDTVLIEIGGTFHRYYAPLMRSAAIGAARPAVARMADVCLEALEAAIAAVKPGATSAEVDAACRRVVERAGLWENYRKRTGYSVGIGFSSWVEGTIASLKEDDPTVLRPGMCFHIPVAMRIYGEAGVGFSHTVHVTGTGVECLTRHPPRLEIR
jgi:Xaa-Pro dipeptidase